MYSCVLSAASAVCEQFCWNWCCWAQGVISPEDFNNNQDLPGKNKSIFVGTSRCEWVDPDACCSRRPASPAYVRSIWWSSSWWDQASLTCAAAYRCWDVWVVEQEAFSQVCWCDLLACCRDEDCHYWLPCKILDCGALHLLDRPALSMFRWSNMLFDQTSASFTDLCKRMQVLRCLTCRKHSCILLWLSIGFLLQGMKITTTRQDFGLRCGRFTRSSDVRSVRWSNSFPDHGMTSASFADLRSTMRVLGCLASEPGSILWSVLLWFVPNLLLVAGKKITTPSRDLWLENGSCT